MSNFKEIFEEHVFSVYKRQYQFMSFTSKKFEFGINVLENTITFGPSKTYSIQLVGSESDLSNTFLWGWSNKMSGLPDNILETINQVKNIGAKRGIGELTTPMFYKYDLDGHEASVVATGLTNSTCYYRAPYNNGAAFYLISSDQLEKELDEQEIDPLWFDNTLHLLFGSKYNILNSLKHYFDKEHIPYKEIDNQISFELTDVNKYLLTFDNLGRLVSIFCDFKK